ncbi:WSC domain-containing protein [Lactarius sanguifluus]|nr:WSC domain-containing protein [Lactarius sanguifluus]
MHRLSFLALASVLSPQVFAASVNPRNLDPPGWKSIICLEDNRAIGLPLFTGAFYADPALTIEKCIAFCDSRPVSYRYMGLTDGFECCTSNADSEEVAPTLLTYLACDNFFEFIFESVPGSCDTPCSGNPLEVGGCGGKAGWQRLASPYQRINSTFVIPALVPSVGLWNGLGCYNDSVNARALQVRVDAGQTTVKSCVAACQAQGFSLAGVEFGRECWCGSQLQHGSKFFSNSDGIQDGRLRQTPNAPFCNMACQGNSSEICGGPALLNLYNFTGTYPIGASVVTTAGGWTSEGCYSDSVSSRTLERRVDVGSVTVESCVAACQSQSFTIAALEYAQECWCGNEIKSPGVAISQSACNQVCTGDSTEVCGGPNALQLYR